MIRASSSYVNERLCASIAGRQEREFQPQRPRAKIGRSLLQKQTAVKPKTKKPAKCGAFSTVSQKYGNCRMRGGGRSPVRTGLRSKSGKNTANYQFSAANGSAIRALSPPDRGLFAFITSLDNSEKFFVNSVYNCRYQGAHAINQCGRSRAIP